MNSREYATDEQLRHEICRRSYSDLYMDVYEIVQNLPRAGLLSILQAMDLDDAEGRKGFLRTRYRFPEY